jgi:hypothetical protein
MIEIHDGGLSYSGYTKVIYRGKEFTAPVDIVILCVWDYMIHLLETGEYKK